MTRTVEREQKNKIETAAPLWLSSKPVFSLDQT